MYFLSQEERRLLLRKLLPEARRNEVYPELRGWKWTDPPLAPVYEARLGLYEIAGQYCSTGRDVYLRRVLKVKAPPNRAMIRGLVLHRAVAGLMLEAKRAIYREGVEECLRALEPLARPNDHVWGELAIHLQEEEELRHQVQILWDFEYHRVMSRVQDVLARQPHVGPDSLVALALPVTLEQKLDGRFLGLSAHLSADAFLFSEPMMMDMKFSRRRDFHRLTTTGYSLVMESIYEYPINVGCVVYVRFTGDRVVVERDFHPIDDELRSWFIEDRDERMHMVEEEIDPGLMAECYEHCPYWQACHAH
jgi:CRISPR-associated protein Csa1